MQLLVLHTVVGHLLGQQVLHGDVGLLVLGVARQADDLHAVEQRRRDVHRVGRGDEHHVGQVEVHLHIVVAELVVLLGVQNLQQSAGRVAPEIGAQLVDFVKQEQRVARADLVQVLQHFARHGADVGAAVAADLRLVAHAAQRHAHVLAARRLGDGLAQRGLAHARRPHQAQDGGLHLVHALLHREVFEDAVLDLLQAVVVLVEDVLGMGEVVQDLGLLAPRQAGEHVDVVAHHRRFGRHGRHELELLEFALGLLARFGRHARGLDLLFDLLDVRAFLALAQFLLNRLDLLVQVEVALVLFHLALHAATDALVHVEDVHLAVELLEQVFQTALDVGQVEHELLVLQLERQVRGNGVGQAAGIVDAGDRSQDLGRNLLVQLDVLVELLHHRTAQRFDLAGTVLLACRLHGRDRGREQRIAVMHRSHMGPLQAFDQHLDRAVGQLEHLQDGGNTTDIEHVGHLRLILGGSLLRHEHDAAVRIHGHFEGLDALGASHEQRDHHVGEYHHVAQRQQRQVDGVGRQGRVSGHGQSSRSSMEYGPWAGNSTRRPMAGRPVGKEALTAPRPQAVLAASR